MSSGPIIGIDINGRRFSYAILTNGEVTDRGGIIDPQDLIKIVKKVRPKAIAIDNIGEIMELSPAVIKRLGRLPFNVHLIQVTKVSPESDETMESLVNKYFGLNVVKLDPDNTAEFLARLCAMALAPLLRFMSLKQRS
ncbi:hypothetical protein [Vulcanisaeta souniana]|uniref:hypothetical protein n=1 Tax=Vulcanisaeta souniana TaxID=164452 RepID=UPI001FB3B071|nr:hypothetical protein [Vulcanisaeta souniana]